MTSREDALDAIDWKVLSVRLNQIRGRLYDERGSGEHQPDALRELLSPPHCGFVPRGEALSLIEAGIAVARENRAKADGEVTRLRTELGRSRTYGRGQAAAAVREWAGRSPTLGKYRREGALLAADYLDGGSSR